MRNILYLLVTLTVLTGITAQSAKDILNDADAMFKSAALYSESTMTVFKNDKAKPVQGMTSYSMEINGKFHSLTVYNSPARMKGTAYLMIEDDLWVRFSSTGRIRKLSSSAKKNSAGGSDFSYADMGDGNSGIAEKYDATLKGEEEVEGFLCYVIELTPKNRKDSPYDRLMAYITVENRRYIKVDHFESGANIKTMYMRDYRSVGSLFYPFIVEMKSNTKNSRTLIESTVVELNSVKVLKRYFTQGYLESIR